MIRNFQYLGNIRAPRRNIVPLHLPDKQSLVSQIYQTSQYGTLEKSYLLYSVKCYRFSLRQDCLILINLGNHRELIINFQCTYSAYDHLRYSFVAVGLYIRNSFLHLRLYLPLYPPPKMQLKLILTVFFPKLIHKTIPLTQYSDISSI